MWSNSRFLIKWMKPFWSFFKSQRKLSWEKMIIWLFIWAKLCWSNTSYTLRQELVLQKLNQTINWAWSNSSELGLLPFFLTGPTAFTQKNRLWALPFWVISSNLLTQFVTFFSSITFHRCLAFLNEYLRTGYANLNSLVNYPSK